MAYNQHADTAGYRKKNLYSSQPSVVGERGTAAIERNPRTPEEEEKKKKKRGGGGGGGGSPVYYEAARLPGAKAQDEYINAMYDANLRRQREALETAYESNVGALNATAGDVPGRYRQAVNQTVGQAAMQKAAFQEQAAATGLNSGARGQAELARNNALLGSVADIRRDQTRAETELENQRNALYRQYQQDIAQAIADNEVRRAEALYQEARRVDESLMATAVNQAAENYKAWKARYG